MTTLQTPLTLVTTATANATLAAGKHTPVDATSGALTMTLPTPVTIGARIRVEKIDTSNNKVTISGTLRGSAGTIDLTSQFHTLEFFAESLTSWRAAADHRTQAGIAVIAAARRVVAASYAATVTPNADTTDVLNVGALTGALTLANPTGTPVDGQNLRVRLAQDATGSRAITFGSGYAFGTDVTSALIPSAASAKWEMLFTWNAADSKWRATAIVRGF